jgi:streptogramin lyase
MRRGRLALIVSSLALAGLAGCGSRVGPDAGGPGSAQGGQDRSKPPTVAAGIRSFRLGGDPWAVATGRGVVWVLSHGNGGIWRIAPSGRKLGPPTRLGHIHTHLGLLGTRTNSLARSGGDVWVGYAGNSGFVGRLDPTSGAVERPVRVGLDANQIAVGAGNAYASYLTKIARIPLAGGPSRVRNLHRTANDFLYAGGRLWASAWNGLSGSNGAILELNPRSLRTAGTTDAADPTDYSTSADEAEPFGLAAGAGSVWAAVAGDRGEVLRINQRSGRETARIPVGTPYPFAVVFADGDVWALDYYANTLTRIDPDSNRVTGRLRVGPPRNPDNIASRAPAGLAASGRTLWVTDEDRQTLTRISLR